jgi:hypothetical protein
MDNKPTNPLSALVQSVAELASRVEVLEAGHKSQRVKYTEEQEELRANASILGQLISMGVPPAAASAMVGFDIDPSLFQLESKPVEEAEASEEDEAEVEEAEAEVEEAEAEVEEAEVSEEAEADMENRLNPIEY